MKLFSEFIAEATAASQQAKKLGLVGDNHGGWYNRATGEFEAKTVGGALQYFNKRQKYLEKILHKHQEKNKLLLPVIVKFQ